MSLALVYDQYYASLAASSTAASAQATPTATGVPSSSNSPDFGNSPLYDDDEDKKPNVEYLDSLNAYRKRSRSQEDVGSADKIKLAKISNGDLETANGHANGHANGFLGVNGFGHYGNGNRFSAEFQDQVMQPQEQDVGLAVPEDDPTILGEPFSLHIVSLFLITCF